MTQMRNRKVIAHVRRNQNLFILKLIQQRTAIATINTKAMTIHNRK